MPLLSDNYKKSKVKELKAITTWFEKAFIGKMRPA